MKPVIFFLFLFVLAGNVHAQQTPPSPPPVMKDTTGNDADSSDFDKEFKTVQIEAQFPGGPQGWLSFLQNTLRVNTPVKHKAPAGTYTVLASFLVDKEGKVYEIKILKDPGYGCAEEVIRVLKKSPDWIPARQNGRNVIYRQKQTITFQVDSK